MADFVVQLKAKDGTLYIFVPGEDRYYKFCPVGDLPSDLKALIKKMKDAVKE